MVERASLTTCCAASRRNCALLACCGEVKLDDLVTHEQRRRLESFYRSPEFRAALAEIDVEL